MAQVPIAIGIMTGLGMLFGLILAVAYRFLRVEEDPRIEVTEDLLPGNNCGACGQPGCSAFAKSLVAGEVAPGKCTVASEESLEEIAGFLGVDVGGGIKEVARLKCAGGEGLVKNLAAYQGMESCRAAIIVDGGERACPWGCMGLGDCKLVCTFDAIEMLPGQGLPQVDPEKCTACGDCVDVCPLRLFVIKPVPEHVFVQCSSPLKGDEARERCEVACDACGLCVSDAGGVTIQMGEGLPAVHYELGDVPRKATYRCPTGAITWIERKQFEDEEDEV